LLLVSVGLIAPGLAGWGPLSGALDPMQLAVAWGDRLYASVPGLGSFMFGLEADHRSINTFDLTLTNFSCGSVFETGPIEMGGGAYSPIIEGQFTFSLQFGADDPMQDQIKALTIKGKFDRTGTQAVGTWTAEVRDSQCSGSWKTS
jgi:hypothetical protein